MSIPPAPRAASPGPDSAASRARTPDFSHLSNPPQPGLSGLSGPGLSGPPPGSDLAAFLCRTEVSGMWPCFCRCVPISVLHFLRVSAHHPPKHRVFLIVLPAPAKPPGAIGNCIFSAIQLFLRCFSQKSVSMSCLAPSPHSDYVCKCRNISSHSSHLHL